MRKIIVVFVALLFSLSVVDSALAWEGTSSKVISVSCPEIHFVTAKSSGQYLIQVRYGAANTAAEFNALSPVVYSKTVNGSSYEQVKGGFHLPDNAEHIVTVAIGNAANIADGFAFKTVQASDCAPPVGIAGPPGPPGTGYDCAGKAVPTGGSPALCPGTPILVPQTSCTSKRVYRFLVRKNYEGHLIRNVRANDPDAKITVKRMTSGKLKGRLQVTADYRGFKAGPFTHSRHIEVDALVATRGWLVLNENADLCRPANGHQNAPSASGDAKPDATSS